MSYLGLRPLCLGAGGQGVLLLVCLGFLPCLLGRTAGAGGGAEGQSRTCWFDSHRRDLMGIHPIILLIIILIHKKDNVAAQANKGLKLTS